MPNHARTSQKKDLLERTSLGSPQDLPIRTCAGSRKDLLVDVSQIFTRTSQKHLCKIMQGPPAGFQQDLKIFIYHRAPREPLNSCKIVKEGTETNNNRFVRLPAQPTCTWIFAKKPFIMRSRNAHGHLTRAIFARIYRKKARDQMEHPDLTPAFNRYCKNPSVWTHCLGKYDIIKVP